MNLKDAIQKIVAMDDSSVIFAKKPWAAQSEAIVSALDVDFRAPKELTEKGYEYFLEKPLIEELAQFASEKKLSEEQLVNAVVYYAIYDAYPAWLNEL